jgi:imidazolonepropionase-like amidohydrolase
VISTLKAFGGGAPATSNLAALRDRGAKVLYGTDYGNSAVPGIDRRELELLLAAGLTPAELLAAGTSAPAAYWGFEGLGAIEPGKDASLLVLESDPLQDPLVLAEPARVLVRGAWQP